MRQASLSWVVAVDGGTTNTRARLIHDGGIVATSRRGVGVRDGVASRNASAVAGAVREVIRDVLADGGGVRPDVVVVSGMLTSEVGLVPLSHVAAPAGVDDLARGSSLRELPEVFDRPILFIPGVKTPPTDGPGGWADADVMRGEECESLGLIGRLGLAGPVALLWPGSHSKLVRVDPEGRIERSVTTLAGELTAAVARHTLIAASLPEGLPEHPDLESARSGARIAASEGLGRAAFLVRMLALAGATTPEQRAAFWVGAVVGDDSANLARHPILDDAVPLWVGGPRPQRELYAEALGLLHDGPVVAVSDDDAQAAAALGALAVARAYFTMRGRRA